MTTPSKTGVRSKAKRELSERQERHGSRSSERQQRHGSRSSERQERHGSRSSFSSTSRSSFDNSYDAESRQRFVHKFIDDNALIKDDNTEEPEVGTCCFCKGECNPASQSCGSCARSLSFGPKPAWYPSRSNSPERDI